MARLPATLLAPLAALLLLASPAHAAWLWPLRGEVITSYQNGDDPYAAGQHRGIDIAGGVGAPVVAAAGGEVRFAGVAGSSGLTVSIRTADGFDTSYLHLASTSVRAGETIGPGERLGAVGTSGTRSVAEPHLHFGVREAGSRHAYRNPLDFLPAPPPVAEPAPGPAPAPAPQPVPLGPSPEGLPVERPAPRPLTAPRRVPAPRGLPVPRATPSPRALPSPLALPSPQPVPGPHAAPRPTATPGPVPARSTLPGHEPRHVPQRLHPSLGPESPPLGSGAETSAAAGRRALRHTGHAGHVSGGARTASAAPGPDPGMVVACAGLLLAAALLGCTSQGRAASARGGRRLARLLRPGSPAAPRVASAEECRTTSPRPSTT